jgi:peptidoglycan/xylan/chitin deacetylase (PgdA/CDA1 family)
MKKWRSLLSAVMMSFCFALSGCDIGTVTETETEPTLPAGLPGGMVSLTFDDGNFSPDMKQAFDKMRANNIPGTLYIVTNWVGDGDGHFSWSDVEYYAGICWEVGNHTKSHQHPLTLTSGIFANEVGLAEVALQQHGITASSFAIPYGDGYNLVGGQVVLDSRLLNVLNRLGCVKTSRQAFTGDNPTVLNDLATFNPMAIKVFSWKGSTPVSYIIGLIDQALAQKLWLVLVIHMVATNPDPTNNDQISLGNFQSVCNYIRNANIKTVTVSQGTAEMIYYK